LAWRATNSNLIDVTEICQATAMRILMSIIVLWLSLIFDLSAMNSDLFGLTSAVTLRSEGASTDGILMRAVDNASAVPPQFFGLHIANSEGRISTPWPTEIEMSSLRNWDANGTEWSNAGFGDPNGRINTARNIYDWKAFDSFLRKAKKSGADVIFTMGYTPRWAAANGSFSDPPSNMAYLADFIKAMLIRAATVAPGTICCVEIWNEMNTRYFSGSIEDAVAIAKNVYQTTKAIDPTIKVITPSVVGEGAISWLQKFLAAGGGNYADILAYHGYTEPLRAYSRLFTRSRA
jgi:hypothetical protein